MNPSGQFERDLERWLEAEAPRTAPADLHEVTVELARTRRQRPEWLVALRGGAFPTPIGRTDLRIVVLLVVLGLAIALAVGAVAGGAFRSDPARHLVDGNALVPASPTQVPTPTSTPAPTPSASAAPLVIAADTTFTDITLKGSGKKVAKFTIPVGSPAIAEATHVGKGNFTITSLAADGKASTSFSSSIPSVTTRARSCSTSGRTPCRRLRDRWRWRVDRGHQASHGGALVGWHLPAHSGSATTSSSNRRHRAGRPRST